jgi:hypothetical protein
VVNMILGSHSSAASKIMGSEAWCHPMHYPRPSFVAKADSTLYGSHR